MPSLMKQTSRHLTPPLGLHSTHLRRQHDTGETEQKEKSCGGYGGHHFQKASREPTVDPGYGVGVARRAESEHLHFSSPSFERTAHYIE